MLTDFLSDFPLTNKLLSSVKQLNLLFLNEVAM